MIDSELLNHYIQTLNHCTRNDSIMRFVEETVVVVIECTLIEMTRNLWL